MAKILVIDDNALVRRSLQAALTRAGHDALGLADGLDLPGKIDGQCVDLAIVEIVMPGRSGIETIMDLRAACPDLRILAMTGARARNGCDVLETACRLGATLGLRKPFTARSLLAAVAQCLTAEPRVEVSWERGSRVSAAFRG